MVLLSDPIVALIYQHGRFGSTDTRATAAALDLYSVGLVAYAAVKVIAPSFYAVGMSRLPMMASVGAVAGNLALNLALHPIYGYRILALGTALAATLNFAILVVAFHRKVAPIDLGKLLRHFGRVLLAAGVMALAVWQSHRGLAAWVDDRSFGGRALLAFGPIVLGLVVYAVSARALGIEELGHYLRRLRRRR
jgi:putative peptidoglycan lipid II flippase